MGFPQARPEIVWFTTAWKIEAARSAFAASVDDGAYADKRFVHCYISFCKIYLFNVSGRRYLYILSLEKPHFSATLSDSGQTAKL